MAALKGDLLVLKIGGDLLGALLSNTFNAAADMIDATSKSSAGAKEYQPGEWGWGMGAEALYDEDATEGFSQALGYIKAGTALTVYWGQTASGGQYFAGAGYLASVDLSGPKNEMASYSLEIQGSAGITESAAT